MERIMFTGDPGATVKVTATDSAQLLSSSVIVREGKGAIGLHINCEDYAIRWAVGGTTPSTTLGHVMHPGTGMDIQHPNAVSTFRFINEVSGSTANIQVTPYF